MRFPAAGSVWLLACFCHPALPQDGVDDADSDVWYPDYSDIYWEEQDWEEPIEPSASPPPSDAASGADEPPPAEAPTADDELELELELNPEPAAEVAFGRGPDEPMTNIDVIAMVEAGLGELVITTAMAANSAEFDVSPKALVALKNAGVPEPVMEAMLAAELGRKQVPAQTSEAPPTLDATDAEIVDTGPEPVLVSSAEITALTQAIERIATVAPPQQAEVGIGEQEPAQGPVQEPAAKQDKPGPGPHAWAFGDLGHELLEKTTAQVALVESKGSTALKTLGTLSTYGALTFASPALAVASEIGGWFRSDDPTVTAVWALTGTSAPRTLSGAIELMVDFNDIPGVNPDLYRPIVTRLVPTHDNFRLVGAARTKVSDLDKGVPTEQIIEEPVAAEITPLGRGHFRIALPDDLPPAEYALVLRPTIEGRQRKREPASSLGELLGAGVHNLLYAAW
ncbi:MAG TPA: hypothetical protein VLD39_11400, partial [Gammaproteobacteria bacterium]|nr:hypothetical protein [Gammaproteobacteria bacterium]